MSRGKRHYQSYHTNFCSHKGLTRYVYLPYPPWDTLEVSSDMKLKLVCLGMFYPPGENEWRWPFQLYKICPSTLIWSSPQNLLPEYLRVAIEIMYTELALYGSTNLCARTNTVFLPISEVCDSTVFLKLHIVQSIQQLQCLDALQLNSK